MIQARIYRSDQGEAVGFRVAGHAGSGEAGRDLVCAAVSALAQTALMGLESWCRLPVAARVAKGDLQVVLPQAAHGDAQAQAIIETMLLGLRAIQQDHAARIKIDEGAVPAAQAVEDRWQPEGR